MQRNSIIAFLIVPNHLNSIIFCQEAFKKKFPQHKSKIIIFQTLIGRGTVEGYIGSNISIPILESIEELYQ